jgi:hypothetical protein
MWNKPSKMGEGDDYTSARTDKIKIFKLIKEQHLYTLYIINRKLEFSNSNSKTKVKVSPINGMSFPIGLV